VTRSAAITGKGLPALFEKIRGYDGAPTTRLALRLLLVTFVRTGELRGRPWTRAEVSRRYPASRMRKMNRASALAFLVEPTG